MPAVSRAYVWDAGASDGLRSVEVCAACKQRLHDQNEAAVKRRVDNEFGLEQANREHFAAARRPSDRGYLAACEQMRREMGLL